MPNSQLESLIGSDAKDRRRTKVINWLLDDLYFHHPDLYNEVYYAKGDDDNPPSGEDVIAGIQDTYPEVLSQILSDNYSKISNLYGAGPRQMQEPTSKFKYRT